MWQEVRVHDMFKTFFDIFVERKMHENASCASRFCHCRAFQQRCDSHCVVCVRWANVRDTSRADVQGLTAYTDEYGTPVTDNV